MRNVDLELGPGAADARGHVALRELQLQPGQAPQRPARRDNVEVDSPTPAAAQRCHRQQIRTVEHVVQAGVLQALAPHANTLRTDLLERHDVGARFPHRSELPGQRSAIAAVHIP
jgi:hypothetical protein